VNTANEYGSTPLHRACYYGHIEVVRELLNNGANVKNANKIGITPLHAAGMNGPFEVKQELLNRGLVFSPMDMLVPFTATVRTFYSYLNRVLK
jgi:ankyrin repeat protein